jgi:hypothetical protein
MDFCSDCFHPDLEFKEILKKVNGKWPQFIEEDFEYWVYNFNEKKYTAITKESYFKYGNRDTTYFTSNKQEALDDLNNTFKKRTTRVAPDTQFAPAPQVSPDTQFAPAPQVSPVLQVTPMQRDISKPSSSKPASSNYMPNFENYDNFPYFLNEDNSSYSSSHNSSYDSNRNSVSGSSDTGSSYDSNQRSVSGLGYKNGGRVAGKKGAPRKAIVHGGEYVLPVGVAPTKTQKAAVAKLKKGKK